MPISIDVIDDWIIRKIENNLLFIMPNIIIYKLDANKNYIKQFYDNDGDVYYQYNFNNLKTNNQKIVDIIIDEFNCGRDLIYLCFDRKLCVYNVRNKNIKSLFKRNNINIDMNYDAYISEVYVKPIYYKDLIGEVLKYHNFFHAYHIYLWYMEYFKDLR